ncbi:MAG TPA: ShlB/FhaC/HecB family hemolysin secretion/activation protein [Devosia sp.]|nr:ShlB/FhaC/HecB family hemolysin secretion/activation protein [Devosia sp.]
MTAAATTTALALVAGLLLVTTAAVSAQQAVERHLPAAGAAPTDALSIAAPDYGRSDEAPLGVDLAGIRLIGAGQDVASGTSRGVTLHGVTGLPAATVETALAPYLGAPLSLGLITRLQADIAALWRNAGYPFMSVTVPPQEVTTGVLTLRVVEFVAGPAVTVTGDADASLATNVRITPGQRVDARALSEDMAWLNRNPYRIVNGQFAPGSAFGTTDLTLKVTAEKPFSVSAGYGNTGSVATGLDRWSIGGGIWVPVLNDMIVSYRFTRGSDIFTGGDLFALDASRAGYLSHAGRIDLPTLPRQALSIAPNYVATNELLAGLPISFANQTFELPILYRSAVSNLIPEAYWGDFYFGIEPKWFRRSTALSGTEIASGEAGLVNFVVGWSHQLADPYGRTAIDARLKFNPGGIIAGNDAATWAAFTGGRVTDPTYVLAGLDVTRSTNLPQDFAWISQFSGLAANQALPDSERLSLAGFGAVRGYDAGDGSVDTGLVWRNELRTPVLTPLAGAGLADSLSPFIFADLGTGYDFATAAQTTLASAGVGFDYAIGSNFTASAVGAVALRDAPQTRAGDFSFTTDLRLSY